MLSKSEMKKIRINRKESPDKSRNWRKIYSRL